MVPPAVIEQQAKLGVSAEESKVERIKRQQARFRDRVEFGRAFVPSTSNPLVDILLARTVSGESPSKAHIKDVTAKRLPPVKVRQTSAHKASATTSGGSQAIAGGGKLPASQKRKKKAPELEDDTTKKQRGGKRAKGKKKAPDTDFGTEQPPSNTKSKSTLKGKKEDTGNGKGNGKANPNQDTSEPVEDDERPPARSSKPRKRKKEDDHDDRPQKTVKFSDSSPHLSSRNLKENQSDKTHETVAKSRIKDVPRSKLLPSRAKCSKGPPREVLERIMASAGRHLHCADSDPDELDCLS